MSKFLHDYANDDAKVIAIPPVCSENSRTKNLDNKTQNIVKNALAHQKLRYFKLLQRLEKNGEQHRERSLEAFVKPNSGEKLER